MKYLLVLLSLVFTFLFVVPTQSFAENEIQSGQSVTYTVSENALTNVKHAISITNLTTNYYVSEYTITLGFSNITNVSASDTGGPIKIDTNTKDGSTELVLHFNAKVVGKGNTLSFTLSYDTNEIARKNGNIWEIEIPRVKDTKDLTDYSATLVVPSPFGDPSYLKPSDVTYIKNTNSFTFQKADIEKGINISFGKYQLYDYMLSYHLHNARLYPIITEIALPPTTAYQEVLLDSLTPKPMRLYRDSDGNWLAKYRLDPSKTIQVVARGKIKVTASNTKKEQISDADLQMYLKAQKYWEVTDPKIASLAKELKTPEKIYQYVVSTLTYDYSRIDKDFPREGAKAVLANPQSAICMEFTDLFIALARAAGIPAREVDGYAYTQNTKLRPISLSSGIQDILHAWPEYYDRDKQVWVAVDPTWGNTTEGLDYFNSFDFNHVGFVVKAVDSEYPNPAGSYKDTADRDRKDVNVTFAKDNAFVPNTKISLETNLPDTLIAGFPQTNTYVVSNKGNALYEGGDLAFTFPSLIPGSVEKRINPIPPLGTQEVNATIQSKNYTNSLMTDIQASLNNQAFTYRVSIKPIYIVYFPLIGGVLSVILVALVAFTTWYLYFQRRKGNNSLRGESQESTRPR